MLNAQITSCNEQIQTFESKLSLMENERKQIYETLTETEVLKEKLQKALEVEKDNSDNFKSQLN